MTLLLISMSRANDAESACGELGSFLSNDPLARGPLTLARVLRPPRDGARRARGPLEPREQSTAAPLFAPSVGLAIQRGSGTPARPPERPGVGYGLQITSTS